MYREALVLGVLGLATVGCTTAEVKPDPQLNHLEQRVFGLEAEVGSVRADRDRIDTVRNDLDAMVAQMGTQISALEAENAQLREQLVERDRLLLAYFHKLREASLTPPRPLPRASLRSPAEATLEERLAEHRGRLASAERENARLREELSQRDRDLLSRAKQPPPVAPQPAPLPPPEPPAVANPPAPAPPIAQATPLAPPVTTETPIAAAPAAPKPPASTPPVGDQRYRLRVISLPLGARGQANVESIARYLSEQKGLRDVKARSTGTHWVVDVGEFTSVGTPEAVELQKTIRELRYQGRSEFRTAYYTRY